jgi:SAM-dependent methyltransferase
MMMGTTKAFDYRLCKACGSVSADDAATEVDLSAYYGKDYYSFNSDRGSTWLEFARRRRNASYFDRFAPTGRTVRWFKHDELLGSLAGIGLRRNQRILDVGCGAGQLVDRLASIGFRSLKGSDPFLDATVTTPNGVVLEKAVLRDIPESFDVIMFNHSLEHVPDIQAELSEARTHLASGGFCLVRLPTPSSEAFRTYGESWVQIDPPRHIALPSREGMGILARNAGFHIRETIDDSTAFAFWGSEMVQKGIPFGTSAPGYRDPATIFSAREMKTFADRAAACNRTGSGDQFIAILQPV